MNRIEEQIKRTEQELEQESRRLARLKNRKTYYEVVKDRSAPTALSLAEQLLKALHRRLRR